MSSRLLAAQWVRLIRKLELYTRQLDVNKFEHFHYHGTMTERSAQKMVRFSKFDEQPLSRIHLVEKLLEHCSHKKDGPFDLPTFPFAPKKTFFHL